MFLCFPIYKCSFPRRPKEKQLAFHTTNTSYLSHRLNPHFHPNRPTSHQPTFQVPPHRNRQTSHFVDLPAKLTRSLMEAQQTPPPHLLIYPHKNSPEEKKAQTMENRRPRNDQTARCKKHPKHQQSPGVCSICLREKLSRLSNKRSKDTTLVSYCSSSSSSLSSVSSYHSSSESSPVHHLYRVRSDAKGSFMRSGGKNYNVLWKSRSMAAAPRTREGERREGKNDMKKKKKKSGFWTKLLRTRSSKKNESGFGQSS